MLVWLISFFLLVIGSLAVILVILVMVINKKMSGLEISAEKTEELEKILKASEKSTLIFLI